MCVSEIYGIYILTEEVTLLLTRRSKAVLKRLNTLKDIVIREAEKRRCFKLGGEKHFNFMNAYYEFYNVTHDFLLYIDREDGE